MIKSSCRRKMAQWAVETKEVSIGLACKVFALAFFFREGDFVAGESRAALFHQPTETFRITARPDPSRLG